MPAAAAAAVLATAAMCTSSGGPSIPSASSVRMLLNTVAPHMDLDDGLRVIPLPTTHHRLQRTYELRTAAAAAAAPAATRDHGRGSHDMLILILAPPSMLRLLRSEQWIIRSEAVVIKWIRGVLLSGNGEGAELGLSSSQGAQRRVKPGSVDHSRTEVCNSCGTKRQHCRARVQGELFLKDVDLLGLLPALVDHSPSGRELGAAYNILSHHHGHHHLHGGGLSLSSLPRGLLTPPERRHVDFQAGRFVRRLSLLQSPSGKFGPAVAVLCPTAVTQTQGRAGGGGGGGGGGNGMEKPGGMDRWSLAFHAILEGILRDAEDMAVTIAYQTIRRHFRRLRSYLDAVTVARLVVLDAAHDSNMMAERREVPIQNGRDKARVEPRGLIADSDDDEEEEEGGGGGGGGHDDGRYPADIRVTGLRDWSNCTFGDPLMAMVFSEEPSRDFLRGFSGVRGSRQSTPKTNNNNDDDDDDNDDDDATHDIMLLTTTTMCGDIIECPEEAHIRLLLYQCYHATVAVVKEFYRPRGDSTDRELAARKTLHAVLARLEGVEDDPKRRHARPPGEMSPAKKHKTEEKGD